MSNAQDGMIPSLVVLKIYYHQVSPTKKEIIKATASFENYLKPTQLQKELIEYFKYTLDFSFLPLTHTDLIIMFAFEWDLYLVLYIGVGFVAILIVGIFTLFHYMMEK